MDVPLVRATDGGGARPAVMAPGCTRLAGADTGLHAGRDPSVRAALPPSRRPAVHGAVERDEWAHRQTPWGWPVLVDGRRGGGAGGAVDARGVGVVHVGHRLRRAVDDHTWIVLRWIESGESGWWLVPLATLATIQRQQGLALAVAVTAVVLFRRRPVNGGDRLMLLATWLGDRRGRVVFRSTIRARSI